MARQADLQVDRTRGTGTKRRGARGILAVFSLLVAALLLWGRPLGLTTTATAQGPTPSETDVSAAHLSPDGCTELIINGGFEVTDLHWALAGTLQPPSYSTAKAYAGERSMRLGIVDSANQDASDGLYQDIALPRLGAAFHAQLSLLADPRSCARR